MEGACSWPIRQLWHGATQTVQHWETFTEESRDCSSLLRKHHSIFGEGLHCKVNPTEEKPVRRWYLPHFPIVWLERATTKTCIVFDSSAKFGGISLNGIIYQGPKWQRDLNYVLLWFRRHPVARICDITEMYLRIEVATKGRSCQQFLWRSLDQQRKPEEYEFNWVVFGINSSPFQAQFVFQTHAEKHKHELPLAAETVSKSTYMDDSMDSVLDDSQGIELYKQWDELWSRAGMYARKWLYNSPQVLEKIIEDRASEMYINKDPLPTVKTLGIVCLPEEDVFTFKANPPEENFSSLNGISRRESPHYLTQLVSWHHLPFEPELRCRRCGWQDLNGTSYAQESWSTSLKNGSLSRKSYQRLMFSDVYDLVQTEFCCQRPYTPL